MYCPECFSDEITQVSDEAVHYDTKNSKVLEISYDSPHQEYDCRNCDNTFGNDEARTVNQQVAGIWKYLCEKYKWNAEWDKLYLEALLKNMDKKQWKQLHLAIFTEKFQSDKGHIEWEWHLTYVAGIRDGSPDGARSFLENETRPLQTLSLDNVKWTPDWQWEGDDIFGE